MDAKLQRRIQRYGWDKAVVSDHGVNCLKINRLIS
jgi:hypothetical protein